MSKTSSLFSLFSFLKKNHSNEAKALKSLANEANLDTEDWDTDEEEALIERAPKYQSLYQSDISPVELPKEKSTPYKGNLSEEVLEKLNDAVASVSQSFAAIKFDPEEASEQMRELVSAVESLGNGSFSLLGGGTEGRAFDIGNDKVLKIFWTKYRDGEKSELARGLLFENKSLPADETMIFASGSLNKDIGWKILEKFVDSSSYVAREESERGGVESRSSGRVFHELALVARSIAGSMHFWESEHPGLKEDKRSFNAEYREPSSALANLDKLSKEVVADGIEYAISLKEDSRVGQRIGNAKRYVESSTLGKDVAEDWMDKFIKHVFYLWLTNRDLDFGHPNLGFRPSTGTFAFFDT
jgi:hypothetical protein